MGYGGYGGGQHYIMLLPLPFSLLLLLLFLLLHVFSFGTSHLLNYFDLGRYMGTRRLSCWPLLMHQKHIIICNSWVMGLRPSPYMMVPEVTGKPGDNMEVKVNTLIYGSIYFSTGGPGWREGVGVIGRLEAIQVEMDEL